MVQQLYGEIEKMKAEIRRLRGEIYRISIGGVVVPTSIISGGSSSTTFQERWKNNTGSDMEVGDAVSINLGSGDPQGMVPAGGSRNQGMLGILMEDTADGDFGLVRMAGYVAVANHRGTIIEGDYLINDPAVNGKLISTGRAIGDLADTGVFAIALADSLPDSVSGEGTVPVLLISNVRDTFFYWTRHTFIELLTTYFNEAPDIELSSNTLNLTYEGSNIRVDSEGATGNDDLETISAGFNGDFLILHPVSDARTITIKHNVGNILCRGNADIVLDDQYDVCMLLWDSVLAKWMAW